MADARKDTEAVDEDDLIPGQMTFKKWWFFDYIVAPVGGGTSKQTQWIIEAENPEEAWERVIASERKNGRIITRFLQMHRI